MVQRGVHCYALHRMAGFTEWMRLGIHSSGSRFYGQVRSSIERAPPTTHQSHHSHPRVCMRRSHIHRIGSIPQPMGCIDASPNYVPSAMHVSHHGGYGGLHHSHRNCSAQWDVQRTHSMRSMRSIPILFCYNRSVATVSKKKFRSS